jgi:hypothetical protein
LRNLILNNKEPYIISNKASSWTPVPLNSKRAKKSVYKFDETLQKIVKKLVYKFDETFFSYIYCNCKKEYKINLGKYSNTKQSKNWNIYNGLKQYLHLQCINLIKQWCSQKNNMYLSTIFEPTNWKSYQIQNIIIRWFHPNFHSRLLKV